MSAEAETIGGELVIGTRERILERALEASRAEVDRREGFWVEGWKAGAEHARREMEILRAQLDETARRLQRSQAELNETVAAHRETKALLEETRAELFGARVALMVGTSFESVQTAGGGAPSGAGKAHNLTPTSAGGLQGPEGAPLPGGEP